MENTSLNFMFRKTYVLGQNKAQFITLHWEISRDTFGKEAMSMRPGCIIRMSKV